jgi:hypothetical protein
MSTYYEKMVKFLDVTREKHGDYAYAAGYLSSLASGMVYEMKQREQYDMADYYERQLTEAIRMMEAK